MIAIASLQGPFLAVPATDAAVVVDPALDLGTLGGGIDNCATQVTDSGSVLGYSQRSPDDEMPNSFMWTGASGISDPMPAFVDTRPVDVNERSTVVASQAIWTLAQGAVSIATRFGPTANIWGVSDRDDFVGSSLDAQSRSHAMVWTDAGATIDLGTLSGTDARAFDINSSGRVVADRMTTAGVQRAVTWDSVSGITQLGTFGGATSDVSALAINESGWIAGTATIQDGTERAFVWRPGSGMTNLGTLGPDGSRAYAINDLGQITGESERRPFIWSESTGMVDVTSWSPPWSTVVPEDINNHGQITGTLSDVLGEPHAFVGDPVNGITVLSGFISYARSINDRGQIVGCIKYPGSADPNELRPTLWTVETPVQIHWTAAEYARVQQLGDFYGYAVADMPKVSVAALAFIIGLIPSAEPTPLVLDPEGTDTTQTIVWQPAELPILESVKWRFALDDEDAHRFAIYLLGYLAAIQGH